MRYLFAMVEQHDSGKSSQSVTPRQFHVLPVIHFHLHQQNLTIELVYGAADMRSYGMTRTAPVSPKINHDGLFLRCFNDLFPKVIQPCFRYPLTLLQFYFPEKETILSPSRRLFSKSDEIQLHNHNVTIQLDWDILCKEGFWVTYSSSVFCMDAEAKPTRMY